jgi:hypothetical protein
MIPNKYVEETNDSKINLDGHRTSSALFINQRKEPHRKIRFDECLGGNRRACDWILEKPNVGRLLVELKGVKVLDAIKQIEESANFLREKGWELQPTAALIICTRYATAPSFTTKIQQAKNRLMKEKKMKVHVKKDGQEFVFEELL